MFIDWVHFCQLWDSCIICVCGMYVGVCVPAELWRFWIHSARASRWRWHHRAVSRASPLPATVRAGWEHHSIHTLSQTVNQPRNCTKLKLHSNLTTHIKPTVTALQEGVSITWAKWTWHGTSLLASWWLSNRPTWTSAPRRSCCSSWWAALQQQTFIKRMFFCKRHMVVKVPLAGVCTSDCVSIPRTRFCFPGFSATPTCSPLAWSSVPAASCGSSHPSWLTVSF